MSAYKIEDFLFFYLVCKIHIKLSKKPGNIFILEKMEPVEWNKLKTLTCNPFIGHVYNLAHTMKLRHKLKFI